LPTSVYGSLDEGTSSQTSGRLWQLKHQASSGCLSACATHAAFVERVRREHLSFDVLTKRRQLGQARTLPVRQRRCEQAEAKTVPASATTHVAQKPSSMQRSCQAAKRSKSRSNTLNVLSREAEHRYETGVTVLCEHAVVITSCWGTPAWREPANQPVTSCKRSSRCFVRQLCQ